MVSIDDFVEPTQPALLTGVRKCLVFVAGQVGSNRSCLDGSMLQMLRKFGMSQDVMYVLGFASVGASIAVWNARKGEDHAHAERFGIFVGLWAPTFFAIGNGLARDRVDTSA